MQGRRNRDRAREEESNTCYGGALNHLNEGSLSWLPLANHLASSGFGLTLHPALTMDSSTRVSEKTTGSTMVWCPSFL